MSMRQVLTKLRLLIGTFVHNHFGEANLPSSGGSTHLRLRLLKSTLLVHEPRAEI